MDDERDEFDEFDEYLDDQFASTDDAEDTDGAGTDWGGEGWGEARVPLTPSGLGEDHYDGGFGYGIDDHPADDRPALGPRLLIAAGLLLVVVGIGAVLVRALDDDDGGDDGRELATDEDATTSSSTTSTTSRFGVDISVPTQPTSPTTIGGGAAGGTGGGSGGTGSGSGSGGGTGGAATTTTTRKPKQVTATTQPDVPEELACAKGGGGAAVPATEDWAMLWETKPSPNDPATIDVCVSDVTLRVGQPFTVNLVGKDPDAAFVDGPVCSAWIAIEEAPFDPCEDALVVPTDGPHPTPNQANGHLPYSQIYYYTTPGERLITAGVTSAAGVPSPYGSAATATLKVTVRA